MKISQTFLIIFISAILAACGSSPQTEISDSEGWVNENTYRVTAVGTIQPHHLSLPLPTRQTLACESAIIMAQTRMLEKFVDAGIAEVQGTVDTAAVGRNIRKYFTGTIRGGDVLRKTFNEETSECEVIYSLTSPGLKRKLQETVQKTPGDL